MLPSHDVPHIGRGRSGRSYYRFTNGSCAGFSTDPARVTCAPSS